MEHGIISERSQPLIDFACRYATEAHEGQLRKYTNVPYVTHPIAVAKIVASVTPDVNMICAAFLHDTIEDTDTTFEDIRDAGFGWGTAVLVRELTNIKTEGTRSERKNADCERIAKVSNNAKTVKIADIIHNCSDVALHDSTFSKVYLLEKRLMLEKLEGGNKKLWKLCRNVINDAYFKIGKI